ncbi:hypothetical protein BGZ76_008577 [Entomortierella beljakovae]|nr:hypothetical protein BGZ76_008577 [Entomortierella beljakovae]
MNKGIGLVAYGDSDSESSDDESPITTAPALKPKESTDSGMRTSYSNSNTGGSNKDSAYDKSTPQDAISAQTILNARSSGNEPLSKIASTNLMKQGLALSYENVHIEPNVEGSSTEGLTSSNTQSFTRSQSGTPLPAEHSAAADVFNTPTDGRSPQTTSSERLPTADEMHREDEYGGDNSGEEGDEGSPQWHNKRTRLMKALLRPKPIPGIENFGILSSPVGEINPDVQAKMEHFHHVKVTRGKHFNQSLMKNKNFRNPHIYSSLVELVALNEIGSNFEKSEFFDFEGYGPESYASGIVEAQKQAAEKLAQQQAAARTQLQFVTGSNVGSGIGFPSAPPGVKPQQLPVSRPQQGPSSLSSNPAATVSSQRSRKSKWDSK